MIYFTSIDHNPGLLKSCLLKLEEVSELQPSNLDQEWVKIGDLPHFEWCVTGWSIFLTHFQRSLTYLGPCAVWSG